ncbi:MAG TPA: tetratricopeptide repeat protein, partial [Chloroflexota bacterium]|nr:tetratricopeptide repeat protein [Chloroflexota bacterium]
DQGQGVDQSDEQAFHWYNKSANHGCAEAQYSLGVMYHNGQGVDESIDEALRLLTLSAENGCDEAVGALQELRDAAPDDAPDAESDDDSEVDENSSNYHPGFGNR